VGDVDKTCGGCLLSVGEMCGERAADFSVDSKRPLSGGLSFSSQRRRRRGFYINIQPFQTLNRASII